MTTGGVPEGIRSEPANNRKHTRTVAPIPNANSIMYFNRLLRNDRNLVDRGI